MSKEYEVKWREVWHVTDGNSHPKTDDIDAVIAKSGQLSRVDRRDDDEYFKNEFLWIDWPRMAAYTLGQKRRRAECLRCGGEGRWHQPVAWSSDTIPHWCQECKGTGKVWEYSE